MTATELLARLESVDAGMEREGIEASHPVRQTIREAIKWIAGSEK